MTEHDDQPIIQVGLVWFDPHGGAERYRDYLAASRPIVERHLGRRFIAKSYDRLATLKGDLDPDIVAINEFPNPAAVKAFSEDPDYPLELLRSAATRVEIIQLRAH